MNYLDTTPKPIRMVFWVSLASIGLLSMYAMHSGRLTPLIGSACVFFATVCSMLAPWGHHCAVHIAALPVEHGGVIEQRCVVCRHVLAQWNTAPMTQHFEPIPVPCDFWFTPGWPVTVKKCR